MKSPRAQQRPPQPPPLLAAASLRIERPQQVDDVATRIWDVETGPLDAWSALIARPDRSDGAPHPTPSPPDRCTLSWVTATGVHRVDLSVSASRRSFGAVWVLTPTGSVTREQRRAYFRVRIAAPVTLHLGESGEATARATLVDLGEGGLFATTRQPGPEVGADVAVALELDDGPIRPSARVVRTETMPGGNRGLALQFVDPELYGPPLRRTLLRVQRQRARERAS